MIALGKSQLTVWADTIGIPNLALAEHDLRLTHALAGIYASPKLKDVLAFKGGTALNKAYFGKFSRLSVDLDFNLIGAPKEVVKQGAPVRKVIEAILKEQDPGYDFKFSYRADQTTLLARYAPQTGGARQPLKIELSLRESVPILGLVEKPIPSPDGAPIKVNTYSLEELLSTKIRALHDRKKGRDIFDLHCARRFELNDPAIRKLVYYYFFRAGKIFSWKGLRANLEGKLVDKRFGDDIKPFLRPDVSFDAPAAIREFLDAFAHFGEPDAQDEEFLALAKGLIGRTTSARKLAKTAHVVHPLKALMHPISITAEALAMTVEDIRPERSNKKENHRDA